MQNATESVMNLSEVERLYKLLTLACKTQTANKEMAYALTGFVATFCYNNSEDPQYLLSQMVDLARDLLEDANFQPEKLIN